MVPLTLAFSFTLEDETVPVTEELVAASFGAARHKYPLGEPDQPFRREEERFTAHLTIQFVWLPGVGMRFEAAPGLRKGSVVLNHIPQEQEGRVAT